MSLQSLVCLAIMLSSDPQLVAQRAVSHTSLSMRGFSRLVRNGTVKLGSEVTLEVWTSNADVLISVVSSVKQNEKRKVLRTFTFRSDRLVSDSGTNMENEAPAGSERLSQRVGAALISVFSGLDKLPKSFDVAVRVGENASLVKYMVNGITVFYSVKADGKIGRVIKGH